MRTESLFARDPRNAELGRDIAVSHDKVGRVLLDDGKIELEGVRFEIFREATSYSVASDRAPAVPLGCCSAHVA